MKTFKILSLILVIGLSSCSIQERIHFNNDFSGTSEYKVDFSAIMALMGDDSAAKEEMDDAEMQEAMNELKSKAETISGISNVDYNINLEEGIIEYSYDFANTEALNAALESEEFNAEDPTRNSRQTYQNKKNKLIVKYYSMDSDTIDEETQSMLDMIEFKLQYSFDREIKSIKCNKEGISFSQSDKTLIQEGEFKELLNLQETVKCVIKLYK